MTLTRYSDTITAVYIKLRMNAVKSDLLDQFIPHFPFHAVIMKFAAIISLAAMALADHVTLDFTLDESFVGTNTLHYTISKNGNVECGGDKTSTDFGQSEFDVRCDSTWQFHVDLDAAQHGNAQVYERGVPLFFTLDKVGFDHQFGCE